MMINKGERWTSAEISLSGVGDSDDGGWKHMAGRCPPAMETRILTDHQGPKSI
jgi:hypothetical protein